MMQEACSVYIMLLVNISNDTKNTTSASTGRDRTAFFSASAN